MVSFYVYDVIFLVLFSVAVFVFLRKRKASLSREGWMFLYRTKTGVKLMDWFDSKFHNTLGRLRYVIVSVGYLLMFSMVYLLAQTVWLYLSRPEITDKVKAPPIAPLIPYFPEIFGLRSMFPPFYFTYFLVALAVVAIVHEFSHGIYMRYSKTKIKSTGMVFLGPIIGAFVEEDQKNFRSKDRFNQMSVLGAGVFANVIFAIIFYLLYVGFFYLAFSASGYMFNSYALSSIDAGSVDDVYEEGNYTVIEALNSTYYLDSSLKAQLNRDSERIVAYDDTPAFKAGLYGVIVGVDGHDINRREDLSRVLSLYSPGDEITVRTRVEGGQIEEFDIRLQEHPSSEDRPYLGVGYSGSGSDGVIRGFLASLMNFRMGSTYYEPTVNADIVYFFYHLLWWVMIINLLVALFNMLPLGILDGGRFFYLTVEKFFGEKVAAVAYSAVSRIIFGSFILIMLVWLYRVF